MQKIPYPLPKADQDVLKQAAKTSCRQRTGSDARLSAAIQVLDMVTLDLRERMGVGHDMTAMSRNKGAAGERGLFRILSYELGVAVRHSWAQRVMAAATEWTFLDGPSKSSAPRC